MSENQLAIGRPAEAMTLLSDRIAELEDQAERDGATMLSLAQAANVKDERIIALEAEVERLQEPTLDVSADVFVCDALENDSPNFRTHTVLFGGDAWEITVRRTDGKTPDQIIHELRAEVERVRTVKNRRTADLTAKIERLRGALTSAQAWVIGAEQNASAAHSGISRILSALTADLEPAPAEETPK